MYYPTALFRRSSSVLITSKERKGDLYLLFLAVEEYLQVY